VIRSLGFPGDHLIIYNSYHSNCRNCRKFFFLPLFLKNWVINLAFSDQWVFNLDRDRGGAANYVLYGFNEFFGSCFVVGLVMEGFKLFLDLLFTKLIPRKIYKHAS